MVWVVLICRVDDKFEDFADYLEYVRFCLKNFEFPNEKWISQGEKEGLTFHVFGRTLDKLIPGEEEMIFGVVERVRWVLVRGMGLLTGEATDEEIAKAYREGRVLDYRPEKRQREYFIWRYLNRKIKEIKEKIEDIILEEAT